MRRRSYSQRVFHLTSRIDRLIAKLFPRHQTSVIAAENGGSLRIVISIRRWQENR